MTINEIQERKQQLEARIDELVTEFSADTGAYVSRLAITGHFALGACREVIATEYVVTAEVVI